MPRVAAAVLRNRLAPAAFQRAVTLAEYFDVDAAGAAGFFDEIVDAEELEETAMARARDFQQLDFPAHKRSKRRVRAKLTRRIRLNLPLDVGEAAWIGLRRSLAR